MTIVLGREKMEELYRDDTFEGYDFEHDGETYVYVDEASSNMDDNGSYETLIYQRKSDGKHFSITITHVRYGYEDYGYEEWANEGELTEVEKRERVIVSWEKV